MSDFDFRKAKKILVLQLGGIGDLTMSLPALKALRQAAADSYIGLFVISRSSQLAEGLPYIDELFVMDIKRTSLIGLFKDSAFSKVLKTIRDLHSRHFDMLINLENISSRKGALKMAVLFSLIGAKYKVGRDTDGRGFFFNVRVKESSLSKTHEVEKSLNVVRFLGADIKDAKLELPNFEKERTEIGDFLRENAITQNDLVIGLNTGGEYNNKKWPEKNWKELASLLINSLDCKIIITGQKKETRDINKIAEGIKRQNLLTATDLSLKQLAALLERYNLFITNDSGPMHMAAALKVPMIVLFGPSDIERFYPYGASEKCIILRKDISCQRPCFKYNCRLKTCMELITVECVMNAVKKVLG